MYIFPNSTIRLMRGVPLDNTYADTIYFETVEQQIEFFYSVDGINFDNQTYQRVQRGKMRLQVSADSIYNCNYLMFKNTSYGTKWFYAFINNVEYINDAVSEITFEIDVMQTWLFDVQILESFVEREHSSNDGIGVNRTPEPIQVNDYIAVNHTDVDVPPNSIYMALSEVFGSDNEYTSPNFVINSDGIPQCFDRKGGRLNNTTLALMQLVYDNYVADNKADDLIGVQTYCDFDADSVHVQVNHPYELDGYTPKNAKVLQYPYCKLSVTNNIDTETEFAFEDFENSVARFDFVKCDTGVPQIMTIPKEYRGLASRFNMGVLMSNYPQVPCSADSYSAYIGNQALPMAFKTLNGILDIATGLAMPTKGVSGFLRSVVGAAKTGIGTAEDIANTFYTASRLPDTMHGASGGNYIAMSADAFKFRYITQTIRAEIAREVDDYFTKFGYATRKLKVPNRNVRPHWCYTKTKGCNAHGNAPSDDIAKITSIYDNGITFWKNGNEVGDYTLDNSV